MPRLCTPKHAFLNQSLAVYIFRLQGSWEQPHKKHATPRSRAYGNSSRNAHKGDHNRTRTCTHSHEQSSTIFAVPGAVQRLQRVSMSFGQESAVAAAPVRGCAVSVRDNDITAHQDNQSAIKTTRMPARPRKQQWRQQSFAQQGMYQLAIRILKFRHTAGLRLDM